MSILLLPEGFVPTYGTAGFRAHANLLDAVVQRCGMIMALKSALDGKKTGVIITASHNPEEDNGVKLIDWTGEMIEGEWKDHVNALGVLQQPSEVWAFILALREVYSITSDMLSTACVIVGTDTRVSAERLFKCCESGVKLLDANVSDLGIVTTPELQYHVLKQFEKYVDYCDYLMMAFENVLACHPRGHPHSHDKTMTVYVDCANGVGAFALHELSESLQTHGIVLELFNRGYKESDRLNHQCGADFVEKTRSFPVNLPETVNEMDICFSLDGDADRVVAFTKKNGKFELLNGDKIAVLLAAYIDRFVDGGLVGTEKTMAIVQTAYANGASTDYIKNNLKGFDVVCTLTGVQHLHEEAKKYDIGVYFEANGHGTVLVKKGGSCCSHPVVNALSSLVSQVTGDAIGNMLAVLAILKAQIMTFEEWIDLYEDIPCLQSTMKVDRTLFSTTDADRMCVKPVGLQDKINALISVSKSGRAFVRPSGTENIIRIYAEARDPEDVKCLSESIKQAVHVFVEV